MKINTIDNISIICNNHIMKSKKTTYSKDGPYATAKTTKTVVRGNKTKVKTITDANYNSPNLYKRTVTKIKNY